ncbi:MAG: hypothetical protein IT360_26685 [Gemmatimonadaceae bacterium]|nr:hypothetical protein [Gemmatimonadaceae bacterium]
MEVQHGGRLIEYVGQASPPNFSTKTGTLKYQNGAWSTATPAPLDPHSGGTWLSMHRVSHEHDSTLVAAWTSEGSPSDPVHRILVDRYRIDNPTADQVEIQIPSSGYWQVPPYTDQYLPTNGPVVRVAAFPMNGDTALMAVSMYRIQWTYQGSTAAIALAAWPQETRLYHILLNTSPPTVQLVSIVPDSAVYSIGLSDDGREKVMAVGRDSLWEDVSGNYGVLQRCSMQWSRPRFSAVSAQQFSDSSAARLVVQTPQAWTLQPQFPEGCPVSALLDDAPGAGTIAPRIPGNSPRPFIAPFARRPWSAGAGWRRSAGPRVSS